MISDEERANNFADSVYVGYHLSTILDDGPRKFGFNTGPNHPFNQHQAELIIEKFDVKGIVATIKSNRKVKVFPSTSLTLEFSK